MIEYIIRRAHARSRPYPAGAAYARACTWVVITCARVRARPYESNPAYNGGLARLGSRTSAYLFIRTLSHVITYATVRTLRSRALADAHVVYRSRTCPPVRAYVFECMLLDGWTYAHPRRRTSVRWRMLADVRGSTRARRYARTRAYVRRRGHQHSRTHAVVRAHAHVHTRRHAIASAARARASMAVGAYARACTRVVSACALVLARPDENKLAYVCRLAPLGCYLRVPAHTYAVARARRHPRVRSRMDEAVRAHGRVHTPPCARTLESLSGCGRVRSRMHAGRKHVRSLVYVRGRTRATSLTTEAWHA